MSKRGIINVNANHEGFHRAKAFFNRLPEKMEKGALNFAIELGKRAEHMAKGHIAKDDLGWQRLSPVTIEERKRRVAVGGDRYVGRPDQPLLDTGEMSRAISTGTNGKNVVFTGIPKDRNHPTGGIPIYQIAIAHEFGVSTTAGVNIPRRPLWYNVASEIREWAQSRKAKTRLQILVLGDKIRTKTPKASARTEGTDVPF